MPAGAEQATRVRMAAATINGPGQPPQAMATAGAGPVTAALQPPPEAGPYGAMPPNVGQLASGDLQPPDQPAWARSAISLPTTAELAAIFDVTTNGQAMLSAVGGLALAILGVRTLFGGRRRAEAPRHVADE
jgi:hypothetical protein